MEDNKLVLESFINFCDNMIIAEEGLDTYILDYPKGKTMILYHGTNKNDLKEINPTSLSMGNRLAKKEISSFWTNNLDYAKIWALDWLAIILKLPYAHMIKEKKFVVPDWTFTNDPLWGKGVSKTTIEVMKYYIRKFPVFVYSAEVPIKDIHRGQLAIDEYTVSKPIIVNTKYQLSVEDIDNYIVMCEDEDDFNKIKEKSDFGKSFKEKSIREKLLFRDPYKTMLKRSAMYSTGKVDKMKKY